MQYLSFLRYINTTIPPTTSIIASETSIITKTIFEDSESNSSTSNENEKGTQYRIDNIELYKVLLKQIGIIEKNIIDSEICTASNNLFHSRRAEGEKFNTNASFMMLK